MKKIKLIWTSLIYNLVLIGVITYLSMLFDSAWLFILWLLFGGIQSMHVILDEDETKTKKNRNKD